MVSAHWWMKAYSVRDAVQGASHLVRYLKREGEFNPLAYVQRTSGKTKDYGDYVMGDVRHMPAWVEGDASLFFTEAARHERSNGYYAFQVEFSLPRELTREQQLALARDVMDATMPDLPALWVMHEKPLEHGELHPHIHVLFSARKQDEIVRGPEQMFKRWNRDHPERGGCEKDVFWSLSQAPEQVRYAFADLTNYHLERAQVALRLDPRSLKRRESNRRAIRRDHDERPDAATLAREQARAREAWEQRKAYKGIGQIEDISREEMVLLVRGWTRTCIPEKVPYQSPAERQAEQAALRQEVEELTTLLLMTERALVTEQRLAQRPPRQHATAHRREQAPHVSRGYDPRGRIFDRGPGR